MTEFFQVFHGCSLIMNTRSESKAYTLLSKYQGGVEDAYIVVTKFDELMPKEVIYDDCDKFDKDYLK